MPAPRSRRADPSGARVAVRARNRRFAGAPRARDDLFAGAMAPRLARIARELTALVADAQSRDWVADRPDRVGFARFGQARDEVARAALRHRRAPRVPLAAPAAATAIVALLVAVDAVVAGPADPLLLAATAAAAVWFGFAVRAVAGCRRRMRARHAVPGPVLIEDPHAVAHVQRRIEACAAQARADRSYRRRAAATDLEYALDWLEAAGEELPRRR